MSAYQRTKGHAFEREIARAHTEITGHPHKRVLSETRDGNSGDVRGKVSLAVEMVTQCKVGKRPNVKLAVEQAMAARTDCSDLAVGVTRWDRDITIAAVEWEDWTAILDLIARAAKAGVYL